MSSRHEEERDVGRQDEGAAARTWQLLMAFQLPAIGAFAAKWLPRDSRRTLAMLALQALGIFVAVAGVWLLER